MITPAIGFTVVSVSLAALFGYLAVKALRKVFRSTSQLGDVGKKDFIEILLAWPRLALVVLLAMLGVAFGAIVAVVGTIFVAIVAIALNPTIERQKREERAQRLDDYLNGK